MAPIEIGSRLLGTKVAPVLREVLNRRLGTVTAGVADSELRGRLSALGDVLIPDGCAFKLANTLAATYANAEAFCLPSIERTEAFGMVTVGNNA